MPKQTKKGTKVNGTNTTKNTTPLRTHKAGKKASTTDSSENPKEVILSEMGAAG